MALLSCEIEQKTGNAEMGGGEEPGLGVNMSERWRLTAGSVQLWPRMRPCSSAAGTETALAACLGSWGGH